MAKPEKVRYSGAAVLVDGVQLKRVQNFSADSDIPQERILELANSGIVDYVDQSPSVSVTIDTNNYGSVDNVALISNALITRSVASNLADPRVGIYASKINTPNNVTVTEQHMLDAYCTVAVPILEASTAVSRTMVLPRAALTGYSLSFDVGGLASENFTLQSFEKNWYFNQFAGVKVYKMTDYNIGHSSDATKTYQMSTLAGVYSGTSQCFSFLGTPIAASTYPGKNSGYDFGIMPIAIIAGNEMYRSSSKTTPFAYTGNGRFYFSTSKNGDGSVAMGITGTWPNNFSTPVGREGDDVYLVYRPMVTQTWDRTNSANPGYNLISTSGSYGGVGKGFINAWLWNGATSGELTSTAAGRALRLQTIGIDVALTSENLDELGTFQSYGIVRIPPVDVTVTVSAIDSDIEEWARLGGKAFDVTSQGELYTGLFNGNNQLRINVYKDKAKTLLLESIKVKNMTVSGEAYSVSVGGNASQELTFLSDNIALTGSGLNV